MSSDKPLLPPTPEGNRNREAKQEDGSSPPLAVTGSAGEAHPPLHLIDEKLSPEEFAFMHRASPAAVILYRIIAESKPPEPGQYYAVKERRLTLHSKEPDKRQPVTISIRAVKDPEREWMLDSSLLHAAVGNALQNNPEALGLLADTVYGPVAFDIEDSHEQAGIMPFARLLHYMGLFKIGRPSTYARVLKRLFEERGVLCRDRDNKMVALTPKGAESGARLAVRCDRLSSAQFALAFDRKTKEVAEGKAGADAFLVWVLGEIDPGRAEMAAGIIRRLWQSADDLRHDRIGLGEADGPGGVVSYPTVDTPELATGQKTWSADSEL